MDPVLNIKALLHEARRLIDEAQGRAAEEARLYHAATGRSWLGLEEVATNLHEYLRHGADLLRPVEPEIAEALRRAGELPPAVDPREG
jgi:hypothetical protein